MTGWTLTLGWTLVHFLWQGTAVAAVAAIALRLLRGASAQARYVTACAALAAALLAPLATATTIAFVPAPQMAAGVSGQPANATTTTAATTRFAGAILAGGRSAWNRYAPQPAAASVGASPLSWLVTLWAAGVLLLTGRLSIGWWRLRRMHTIALAEPASVWLDAATRIASRLGLSRAIHVVDSSLVETPAVIGWLRPVVLLPVAALANLTPAQVQAILAHELAHIRRHDFLVNLLQTLAETILFYHPAIWWLSARIRTEREHCCDDIAVEVCGDPVVYVEALTELASWALASPPLAMAAAGGSLLTRVRRLLLREAAADRRRPKAPIVIAATVLLVLLVGVRWMVVAQGLDGRVDDDRGRGTPDINRLVGFELVPPRLHYPTDDPANARAWTVTVALPGGGETSFLGFTARGLVRYAYEVDGMPVMDGPSWLDTESQTLHAETAALNPEDQDFRLAIRTALEQQFGISIRHEVRDYPVLAMVQAAPGRLGPNIHPWAEGCLEGRRVKPDVIGVIGPTLVARGQQTTVCGIDNSILGFSGIKVSMAELARSFHGFPMGEATLDGDGRGRDIVDQTGIEGDFDFHLSLGLLPLAAIATAHPDMAPGLRPLGVRTLPDALEQQLGLKLVPAEAPREVVLIASAAPRRTP